MDNKRLRETFNDGILEYGQRITMRTDTGKRIGDQFVSEGRLWFKEMSHRETDYRLADALGTKLDMKVKTLFPPTFNKKNKVKLVIFIDEIEYETIRVDHDDSKAYLYFYLRKVGEKDE